MEMGVPHRSMHWFNHNMKRGFTLKSVGTCSLGVFNPESMSRPTKSRMDMKIEKSLISLRSLRKQQEPKRRRKRVIERQLVDHIKDQAEKHIQIFVHDFP